MDKNKLILIIIWLPILLIGVINLLTVFSPEIGFDALWYHLTLPKLWLLKKQWFFDGGLLYYSVMPRLTETIFIPLIKYTGFVGPKLLQFISGLGVGFLLWKLGRKFRFSLIQKSLAVSLFYCTWLVSWQSGSAYIDLFRTLLETASLYYLISGSWRKGGMFLGLAIGTKWLSLGSLGIYTLVFGPPLLIPALFLSLPWFVVAYFYTGNPVYPILSPILHQSFVSVVEALKNILFLPLRVTLPFDDFLSPLVGVLVILSALAILSSQKQVRQIALVGVMGSLFSVILEPPSSRFFLPYFPAVIIAAVFVIGKLKLPLQNIFIFIVTLSALTILTLRIIAVKKYLPYLLGQETETEFLTKYSSRLPDTFIDSDLYVRDQIPPNSKILVDKLHNLYYFPVNFDHTSWVKARDDYDYLVTVGTNPSEIGGRLLHTNSLGIQIYRLLK